MTIEEAIVHMDEVANTQEECAIIIGNLKCDNSITKRVAAEHRQLAEWLRELIHLRNLTEYLRDSVTTFEFMGSMYFNEDIIKFAEEELRIDMREVNEEE